MKFFFVANGISGVLLVPENDSLSIIKCYNQEVHFSDGTSRNMTVEEQKFFFFCHKNQKEKKEVLATKLTDYSIKYFQSKVEDYRDELAILKKFKGCEHVVQLINDGECDYSFMVGIKMERFPMNLNQYINAKLTPEEQKQNLSLEEHMRKQLIAGLKEIHHIDCVHLDIKPSNILFDPSRALIKYADFGNASFNIPNHFTDCTKGYRAPELYFRNKFKNLEEVKLLDIWSLGCVFYELVKKEMLLKEQVFATDVNKNMFENAINKCAFSNIANLNKMINWKVYRKNIQEL